jgi:hypothetical protein
MAEEEGSGAAGFDAQWERFRHGRRPEIDAWLAAELAVANGARNAGETLIVAEAALQRAIVDFVSVELQGDDPMPLVLELLRRAEELLRPAPATSGRKARAG